jgi:ATP-dependent RNA helicase MSS116
LVLQANDFAKDVGLVEQPSLQKKTVGKMGLKGVPGLKIEG